MTQTLKTVALLVANPALSSILATTLAGVPLLRVRPFETELALTTYLSLAPADLVVADIDGLPGAGGLPARLRRDPEAVRLSVLALASARAASGGRAALGPGFDEVLVKPMSPAYLVERVLARLAGRMRTPRAATRDWSAFGENVVPLFR